MNERTNERTNEGKRHCFVVQCVPLKGATVNPRRVSAAMMPHASVVFPTPEDVPATIMMAGKGLSFSLFGAFVFIIVVVCAWSFVT